MELIRLQKMCPWTQTFYMRKNHPDLRRGSRVWILHHNCLQGKHIIWFNKYQKLHSQVLLAHVSSPVFQPVTKSTHFPAQTVDEFSIPKAFWRIGQKVYFSQQPVCCYEGTWNQAHFLRSAAEFCKVLHWATLSHQKLPHYHLLPSY